MWFHVLRATTFADSPLRTEAAPIVLQQLGRLLLCGSSLGSSPLQAFVQALSSGSTAPWHSWRCAILQASPCANLYGSSLVRAEVRDDAPRHGGLQAAADHLQAKRLLIRPPCTLALLVWVGRGGGGGVMSSDVLTELDLDFTRMSPRTLLEGSHLAFTG